MADEPFHAAAEATSKFRAEVKRSRHTEAELVEAITQEEDRLGRPMSQRERESFVRGFFSRSTKGRSDC